MNKIFLDINIVLDMIDSNRKNNSKIPLLLKKIILNDIDIVISEDMLSTLFYIQKDKKLVLKFLNTIQNKWIISPYGKDVISKAIEISLQNNLDLEDILQCLCAKKNSCIALVTSDSRFYDCGIKIYTIDEAIEAFENKIF